MLVEILMALLCAALLLWFNRLIFYAVRDGDSLRLDRVLYYIFKS